MNKKAINIILTCLLTFTMIGCSATNTHMAINSTNEDSSKANQSSDATSDSSNTTSDDSKPATQADPTTYKYSANSRFKVVSLEKIDDGTTNGQTISILVDKDTKVMYMQNEKRQNGYGLSLQVMVDKDGKPLLYDGDLG